MADERITRDDLEAELRATVVGTEDRVAERRSLFLTGAVVVVVSVVAVAWLVGRRAGQRRSTVVEVRRI
ncbi:MAG: hypothetical protein QF777_06690 [Acidimicrobiales bacterium]|jgi:hypothetical protein|nr:hypothetical protein [Actinomycetes bacterium]MDP6160819.1 hypothetical protein [Acidimicrobiales bacterium]MDP6288431.1 hypothetical protein [Acidimicrobiales bacterium]MDP6911239.1 hypothetical protein [Acidimicrobiales bacterium]HJM73049.1 hypothetical protein [Acidimicrobiales bacterium]